MSVEPRDPDYEQRVRTSFAGLMATFVAELGSVAPGAVEIEVACSPGLTQQDEFFHAGLGAAVLAGTCSCAAPTLMAPGMPVLTVDIEVNLLAPRSASPCGGAGRSQHHGLPG